MLLASELFSLDFVTLSCLLIFDERGSTSGISLGAGRCKRCDVSLVLGSFSKTMVVLSCSFSKIAMSSAKAFSETAWTVMSMSHTTFSVFFPTILPK